MIDSQQQQQQVSVTPSPAAGRRGGGETVTPSSVAEGTPASHLEDGTRSKEKRKLSVREIVSSQGRGE
jgi:hypothetical protein